MCVFVYVCVKLCFQIPLYETHAQCFCRLEAIVGTHSGMTAYEAIQFAIREIPLHSHIYVYIKLAINPLKLMLRRIKTVSKTKQSYQRYLVRLCCCQQSMVIFGLHFKEILYSFYISLLSNSDITEMQEHRHGLNSETNIDTMKLFSMSSHVMA